MAAHGWIVNRFYMRTNRRTAARRAALLAAYNHALADLARGRMKAPDFASKGRAFKYMFLKEKSK